MECFGLNGNSPPPEVVLFDRPVWSDRNLLLHFQKLGEGGGGSTACLRAQIEC